MARRKYQFKPDRQDAGFLNKMYITKRQRLTLLKWGLYSALFLGALVIQDSVLSRYRVFDGLFDLAPTVIILVTVVQGSYSGSVFALVMSMVYVFAGTGPGNYAFFLLTLYACLAAVFREGFMQRSKGSIWMCGGIALAFYEMTVFGIGMLMKVTYSRRIWAFLVTILLSILVMPVLRPIVERIGKIGGETWRE